ncbi:WYL domain-containing protein [bacterium]|nr:WYL domain-containing protein [bacterium]
MKKPDKNFDTGLRILEVLKILLENDITKNELISKMNNNPHFSNVYTCEAFIKYFNTLSVMGFKIEKEKNVYKLKNALERIDISKSELDVILELINYIKKLHNKKLEETIKNLLYKSIKYMDENTQKTISNALKESAQNIKSNNVIDALESILYNKCLVNITYIKNNNTQDSITVTLKEIIEKKNDIILLCYDKKKARNKKINVASIISIKQTPIRACESQFNSNSVLFRIYGRLAQTYKLKEEETVVDFTAGYKTISNKGEDKDIIIKRLLKYGENCKILHPASFREEFLTITDEILKNLEGEIA